MELPVSDRLEAVQRLSPQELARLLGRVPVVVDALHGEGPLATYALYQPRVGLRRLATLLALPLVIRAALESLDRFEFQLASLAAWHGGNLERARAIAEAGPAAGEALDAAADTLAQLLLADRTSHWLTLRPGVEEMIGFGGIRARDVLAYEPGDVLAGMLLGLGRQPPPRRSEWLAAVEAALRDRATIDAVAARMPKDAQRVFWLLAEHGPQAVRDLGIPFYQRYVRQETPLHWLTRHGLAGVESGSQVAWVWLDVIVGLNGCLYRDWSAKPPPVTPEPLQEPGGLPLVLTHLDALLELWAAEPAPTLASGGLGVRPVRSAAKALGVPAGEIGLLAHLAIGLGLLARTVTGAKGTGRQRIDVYGWAPTGLAKRWSEQPPAQRWGLLVQAWRDNPALDESEGLPERWEGTALSPTGAWARTAFLRLLVNLPADRGLAMKSLEGTAAFHHPGLFDGLALGGVTDAARVLGLVPATGPIGLTCLGRALLDGPDAVEAALPAPRTDFTVQADHTVIAPPDLALGVTTQLERYADLESAAGARIYRLSERRIAAALDDGDTAENVLGFLEKHSAVPVAQNITHMIHDVQRRHGRLRAGAMSSYLRCDDPALLTSAVGVKGAKLHLLAPTVAVSPLPADKLVTALRARGLMPVAETPDGAALARPASIASTEDHQLPALRPSVVLGDQAVLEALAKQVLESDR